VAPSYIPLQVEAPVDHRHSIGTKCAIGDPCALKRWQDHHNCGGLFVGITTNIT